MIRYASILVLFFSGIVSGQNIEVEKYREASEKTWAKELASFAERDQLEKHPDDSILFVGSSSIRMWKDIGTDMQPYHAIQRGFGGSNWSDVAVFADRIIKPHTFRSVVFFVGNDIVGRESDKTPEEIVGLFDYVVKKVRDHNPEAQIFYIAVTPSSRRFAVWPKIRAGNSAVRDYCNKRDKVFFIDTESLYLGADGKPRDELFLKDKLHQNRDGYIVWKDAIKAHLDRVMN